MVSQPSSPSSPTKAELLLKFLCSNCDQVLNVGIERLATIKSFCPRCDTPIQFPPLDRNVIGVETILQSNPETLRLHCPECGCTSKTPVRAALKKWTCPACKTPAKLKFAAHNVKVAAPAAPSSSRHERAPIAIKETRDTSEDLRETADWAQTNDTEEIVASREPDSEAVVYGSAPPKPSTGSYLSGFLSSLSPRTLTWVIWFILQFPVLLFILLPLAQKSMNIAIVILTIAWFIPRLGICTRLTWLIMTLFMKSFRCPHCDEEYEAVSRWGCSCGYVDHKDQHIYGFKCPQCKSVCGHYNCRRCEATILLR